MIQPKRVQDGAAFQTALVLVSWLVLVYSVDPCDNHQLVAFPIIDWRGEYDYFEHKWGQ